MACFLRTRLEASTLGARHLVAAIGVARVLARPRLEAEAERHRDVLFSSDRSARRRRAVRLERVVHQVVHLFGQLVSHPLDDGLEQVVVVLADGQDEAQAARGEVADGLDHVASVARLVGALAELHVGHERADAAADLQVVDVIVARTEQHEHEAHAHAHAAQLLYTTNTHE